MPNLEKATELALALKRSSHFTAGDYSSFSIPIVRGQLELPGKYNPAAYFDAIDIKSTTSVGIYFAGNGGLCVEALHRGASSVFCFEARSQNIKALQEVNKIMEEATSKKFEISSSAWGVNDLDLIIWPEGIDQVGYPVDILASLYGKISARGKLVVEVTHGQQTESTGSITSWKPDERTFLEAIKRVCKDAYVRAMKGRLDRRVIYEISHKLPKEEMAQVVQKAVETKKPEDQSTVIPPTVVEESPNTALENAIRPVKKVRLRRKIAKPSE